MVVMSHAGNVLPLEEILAGTSHAFQYAVGSAIQEAGFDVTITFDIPSLQLASVLLESLGERIAPHYPLEWPSLKRFLVEAGQAGILVDVRPRPTRTALVAV